MWLGIGLGAKVGSEQGSVAQLVECSLSMGEVPGSKPGRSSFVAATFVLLLLAESVGPTPINPEYFLCFLAYSLARSMHFCRLRRYVCKVFLVLNIQCCLTQQTIVCFIYIDYSYHYHLFNI